MLEKSSKACDTNKEKVTDKSHNERIPWDQYFMAQAVLLSLRSTCTRLEVGATLVREKGSLLAAIMEQSVEMSTA